MKIDKIAEAIVGIGAITVGTIATPGFPDGEVVGVILLADAFGVKLW